MRLEPVLMPEHKNVKELLTFFMGKNTPDRQDYIVSNLRVEKDILFDGDNPSDALAA
jgi:topoisomerase-4 subunit B